MTISPTDFVKAKNSVMELASKPVNGRFAEMSLKDAKRERLIAKGLLPKSSPSK